MSGDTQSLLSELDGVLRSVSRTRHLDMLRQMTDLFLAQAASYTAEQVALFDAVIKRLSQNISSRDLIELSARLAALDGAPEDTVVQLSESDDIAVSGPVLERSNVLKDTVLVGVSLGAGPSATNMRAAAARIGSSSRSRSTSALRTCSPGATSGS